MEETLDNLQAKSRRCRATFRAVKRHVALVGFMASGKSTIGRKLARKLGWTFRDTDALVVRSHGPIPAIFENEGEAAFRRYEQAAIAGVLESCRAVHHRPGRRRAYRCGEPEFAGGSAYRIFIKISPEQILARARRSREVRPMLGSRPTLSGIKELYARRMPNTKAQTT